MLSTSFEFSEFSEKFKRRKLFEALAEQIKNSRLKEIHGKKISVCVFNVITFCWGKCSDDKSIKLKDKVNSFEYLQVIEIPSK